jgi:hypothetical protein
MKSPDLSRAHRVESGGQAGAINHPVRSRLLLACSRRERNLTELARELGQSLQRLHYHQARLVDCGLLRVSRVKPRRGRPIRYYRAIAEAFVVSLADIDEHVGEKLARELRQSLAKQANRSELSLYYHLDQAGRMRVHLVDHVGGMGRSRAFDFWKILRLTTEQRKAMAGELRAVVERYEATSAVAGGEPFLVHAAFAPKL